MKYSTIRTRVKQRKRLAKAIKDLRSLKDSIEPERYIDGVKSLIYVSKNYPKIKDVKRG